MCALCIEALTFDAICCKWLRCWTCQKRPCIRVLKKQLYHFVHGILAGQWTNVFEKNTWQKGVCDLDGAYTSITSTYICGQDNYYLQKGVCG